MSNKSVNNDGFFTYFSKNKAFLFMLLPGTIFLIINSYIPMFGIIIAFKNINYRDGIIKSPWVGFKNFEFLFKTTDAFIITRNTILYNVAFIFLNLLFAVVFAVILCILHNRYLAKLYQSIMFLPYFLSMVVVGYIVYAFLADKGFVNQVILSALGIKPIKWYFEAKYWPFILPFINVWKNVGYYSVIYLAAIMGIDKAYYEAAIIDGASKWQQITKIMIPLIKPQIIIMTLLQIGRIFYADFGLFYQVTLDSGPLYSTTNVIDTYVYRALMRMGDIGMASAAGFYQAVVGFIVVLVANIVVSKIDPENALF